MSIFCSYMDIYCRYELYYLCVLCWLKSVLLLKTTIVQGIIPSRSILLKSIKTSQLILSTFLSLRKSVYISPKRAIILAQKMKFPLRISSVNVIKSAKKLRIWSHLLKKFLTENFIFCLSLVSLQMLTDLQLFNFDISKILL